MKKPALLLALAFLFACQAERGVTSSVAQTDAIQTAAAQPQRQIVRTATMRITVADTAKAVNDVTASVEALNGYVAGSEVWREGELLRARLTLRVPSKSLTPALAAIRKTARRVDSETTSSEDVTREYVDLQAQLRNLEATEVELRELLTTVRQNARKAAEILEVHQQLMKIRGEIEQTTARIQQLGHNVAMSHIGLDVVPDAITKPVVEEAWQPVVIVKDATRAMVGALRAFAAATIWIVIYVVPVGGTLAVVFGGIWLAARRLRRSSVART